MGEDNIQRFNAYAITVNGRGRHYKLFESVTLRSVSQGVSNWTPIGDWAGFTSSYSFTGSFDGGGNTISNLTRNYKNGDYVDGLFGSIDEDAVIENLGLTDVNINGNNYVGGLVGRKRNGTVRNCYVTGNITGSNYVGGLVGINENGTVQNSYTATRTLNGEGHVGGVVGWNGDGANNTARVQECYATGSVNSSGQNAGGVVGYNRGTVKDCYATGNVISRSSYVGGVVGQDLHGIIENCYATGIVRGVIGNSSVGGVLGATHQNSRSMMRNCVALNPRVVAAKSSSSGKPDNEDVGRITAYIRNNFGYESIIIHNYARDDMDIRYGVDGAGNGGTPKTMSVPSLHNGLDGEDIDETNYGDLSFWTTILNFTDAENNRYSWDFTNVWQWNDANTLPTLRNVGGTQNPTVQQ